MLQGSNGGGGGGAPRPQMTPAHSAMMRPSVSVTQPMKLDLGAPRIGLYRKMPFRIHARPVKPVLQGHEMLNAHVLGHNASSYMDISYHLRPITDMGRIIGGM